MEIILKPRFPGLNLHTLYDEMIRNPPSGYSFKYLDSNMTPTEIQKGKENNDISYIVRYLVLLSHTNAFAEAVYAKSGSSLEILFNKLWIHILERTLHEYQLIWACQHVLPPDKIQWIGDFEHSSALCGYGDPKPFRKYLKKCILSKKCLTMLAWSNKAKVNVENILSTDLSNKLKVIYPAVKMMEKDFTKEDGCDRLNLIHVGTWRSTLLENHANYLVKGTRDTLVVAKKLLEKFGDRIRITIRSYVPPSLEIYFKNKFKDKVQFIKGTLPRRKIFEAYHSSDILLLPCHSTPTLAFVEAMSCGLPVVTTDVWANNEILENGTNAFLIKPPSHIRYEDEFGTPLWYRSEFMKKLERIDNEFIHNLCETISYLIEDENLLNLMKKNAMSQFKAKYTIEKRNSELKQTLDEI